MKVQQVLQQIHLLILEQPHLVQRVLEIYGGIVMKVIYMFIMMMETHLNGLLLRHHKQQKVKKVVLVIRDKKENQVIRVKKVKVKRDRKELMEMMELV